MYSKICVIGGGVNGFSSAIKIIEYFGKKVEVTLISDEFTPNTTGDISAGLWGPYLMGTTKTDKIFEWAKAMHDFLEDIWLSEDAGEAGVCLISVTRISSNDQPLDDFWKEIVYGFRYLNENELNSLSEKTGKKVKSGVNFTTYTSEPIKLLPFMMKRFKKSGGIIIKQKIDNLFKFAQDSKYDCIINCTGLGSRNMFENSSVYAIRGQVSRVKANWLFSVFLDESDNGNYIIPNCESVVLGGTHQINDYNTNIYESDKNFITEGCTKIIKGLEKASLIEDQVGLRPGRTEVRIQVEEFNDKIIIHNYGHGGSGVTICWGCANEVLNLLIKSNKISNKL